MALTLALCFLTVALPTARARQSTGVIAGRVVMEDGSAMPGVMVFVSGGPLDRPLVDTTRQTGEFRFPRLRDGTYALAFRLSGFAWSEVRDVRVENDRVTDVGRVVMRIDKRQFNNVDAFWLIHFVTSEGAFDLAIPSPDGCNGSVCVSTGSPLTLGSFFMGLVFLRAYDNGTIQPESATDPGGLVIYSNSGKRSEALHVLEDDRVTTDPDGKYPVGRLSRRTGDDDTVAAIRKLKRLGSEFARPVIIYSARLPGEPAPPAREQKPAGAIGGRIVDESGGVIPGVTVTVRGLSDATAFTTTTQQDGTFRVAALREGTYAMTAAIAGFRPVDAKGLFVPAPAADGPSELIYLVGENIATDVEGKNIIGRVWHFWGLRDAAIMAASRPTGGDERPTPVFIVRAALMIFLVPAPAPAPAPAPCPRPLAF